MTSFQSKDFEINRIKNSDLLWTCFNKTFVLEQKINLRVENVASSQ